MSKKKGLAILSKLWKKYGESLHYKTEASIMRKSRRKSKYQTEIESSKVND